MGMSFRVSDISESNKDKSFRIKDSFKMRDSFRTKNIPG